MKRIQDVSRGLAWVLLTMWLSAGMASMVAAVGRVDANTASVDMLQTVPGIGPVRAQRIQAERQRGLFKSLDDLHARVPGIGPKTIARMAAAGLTVLAPSPDTRTQATGGVVYHVNR